MRNVSSALFHKQRMANQVTRVNQAKRAVLLSYAYGIFFRKESFFFFLGLFSF